MRVSDSQMKVTFMGKLERPSLRNTHRGALMGTNGSPLMVEQTYAQKKPEMAPENRSERTASDFRIGRMEHSSRGTSGTWRSAAAGREPTSWTLPIAAHPGHR